MVISAKEAQRLSRTKWQAELYKLDNLIKNAIWDSKEFIIYEKQLYSTTIEYLFNLGYEIIEINSNTFKISWGD